MLKKITYISLVLSLNFMVLADLQAATKSHASSTPTTTGFMQELTQVRVHEGADRSGKEIYEYRCKGCHGKNTQGAPMPDDTFEWSMRLRKKGLGTLLRHAMDGFNNTLMPAKGGCRNCNKNEVHAAVFYMLKRSGVKLEHDRPDQNQHKKTSNSATSH